MTKGDGAEGYIDKGKRTSGRIDQFSYQAVAYDVLIVSEENHGLPELFVSPLENACPPKVIPPFSYATHQRHLDCTPSG
ncbi:hypothetical protein SprV_0100117100 [Sparganum proliferum]